MGRKRVLVVDDETRLAFLLKQSLLSLGSDYDIQTASSGPDALRIMDDQPCDLVITDYRMEGMGGLDLMKAIQSRRPGTLVILMTAYGTDELAAEAERLHAYRYITKPFPIEEFQRIVQEAFQNTSYMARSA